MTLGIVNPIEFKGWDDLLPSLPNTSIFHTSHWARVLHETYRYKPMYFVDFDRDKCLFMLPMMSIRSWITGYRGVSLPFTDYCVPYACSDDHLTECMSAVFETGKKIGWKSIELRGGSKYLDRMTPKSTYYAHVLRLTDEASLLQNLKDSNRRNIKKASKQNVDVVLERSSEAMDDFYQLNCITRKKHGLPPQPLQFFKNLNTYVLNKGLGDIFLARWNGRTIAASIFLRFGGQAVYKYGASDIEHLPLRANNKIMWVAILHYLAQGCETFHFGKTEANNDGLRRYKLGWGAEEQALEYYRYNLKSNRFEAGVTRESGWHTSVFSRMPMPILTQTGRLVYKHIG